VSEEALTNCARYYYLKEHVGGHRLMALGIITKLLKNIDLWQKHRKCWSRNSCRDAAKIPCRRYVL